MAKTGINGPGTSGGKNCAKSDSDKLDLPGDKEEPLYEPLSLVASACKPTWFPLCLEAAVTQRKECPCHTVGACGRSFWWARGLALGCASPSEPRPSFLPLSPACTDRERDEAFLGSPRANPSAVGAPRRSLRLSGTQFLSCETETARDYLPSLGERF